MMLKAIRMVLPFIRLLISLAPTCPPANEAAAAGRINHQLMASMEAYPKNPVSDEKHTINVDEAAAMRVGVFKT